VKEGFEIIAWIESINEKAQSSIEPKATGVKMRRRIKITLMIRFKP